MLTNKTLCAVLDRLRELTDPSTARVDGRGRCIADIPANRHSLSLRAAHGTPLSVSTYNQYTAALVRLGWVQAGGPSASVARWVVMDGYPKP